METLSETKYWTSYIIFMVTFKIMLCRVTIFGVHKVPAGGQTYLSTSALIS